MKRALSILLFVGTVGSISGAIVGHSGKYFTVTEHDRSYRVGRESLDNTLRHINKSNMAMFMQRGRISARKTSDGSYILRGHVHGLGGGPIAGWVAYWGTKALCYGTAVAAAGTAVVATGGALGAASGVIAAAATGGATTGATLVGAGIAGAGMAGEAVAVSSSAVAAFGGLAGAATAVETTATSLGLLALSCPFLP